MIADRISLRAWLAVAASLAAAGCQAYDHGLYARLTDAGARDAADAPAPLDVVADVAPDVAPDVVADAADAADAVDVADVVDAGPVPDTLVYVLDSIHIDPTDTPDGTHTGFDLDSVCSDGSGPRDCGHADFRSTTDPDQDALPSCGTSCHPGCVDNQLPTIADAYVSEHLGDPRSTLPAGVAANRLVYLLRVTGIDSLGDDTDVVVSFYRGLPTFDTDCDRVLPGRTYRVDRASLTAGGSTLEDSAYRVHGAIVAGRLRVVAPAGVLLAIDLSTGGTLSLDLSHLRVTLTTTTGTDGNLGGSVSGQYLADTYCAVTPTYCTLLRNVVGSYVDIQRMGVCYQPTSTTHAFGDIGVGVGFTMVEARIDPTTPVADAREAGACGATPDDAGTGDAGSDAGAADAGSIDGGSDAATGDGAADVVTDRG